MRVYNTPNIIAASTVMNTTINSQAMQLENMFGYTIQIVFTGTPTGSFKLQASADAVAASLQKFGANGAVTLTPANWTDIANSTFSVVAAGNVEWNVADSMYNYVRVVYTDLSGGESTAVITSATMNGKGF